MGFVSFLKVHLKQIPGKLPDAQKFSASTFDVYVTLGVSFHGMQIVEITKSLIDDEYDEVNAVWFKEWMIDQNAWNSLECQTEKDEGESFKKNFVIHLVNCFFSGLKNRYCSKSVLKYVKNVNRIALDFSTTIMKKAIANLHSAHMKFKNIQKKQQPEKHDGGPSFSHTLALHEPDTKAENSATTSVVDIRVSVEKEDHCENVFMDQAKKETNKDNNIPSFSLGLGLSQPNRQSPVPYSTSVPDPKL
ncbi:hypothetical protein Cgig2_020044 [Carnegiea gigantea]|uniref:Uncharacterized protein n=1 Tax=Carnegiea gigantea TaxID=171969 RepID=A0A9Q1GS04_9CARY|nr:hypothetical protein Cgig2_020044 [Carnegiea gigantea]